MKFVEAGWDWVRMSNTRRNYGMIKEVERYWDKQETMDDGLVDIG